MGVEIGQTISHNFALTGGLRVSRGNDGGDG